MPNCDVCTRFYSEVMKPVCGVHGCPVPSSQRADPEYDQDDIDAMHGLDDERDGFDECGKLPDGTCMLAGTEHCDFECPHSG